MLFYSMLIKLLFFARTFFHWVLLRELRDMYLYIHTQDFCFSYLIRTGTSDLEHLDCSNSILFYLNAVSISVRNILIKKIKKEVFHGHEHCSFFILVKRKEMFHNKHKCSQIEIIKKNPNVRRIILRIVLRFYLCSEEILHSGCLK